MRAIQSITLGLFMLLVGLPVPVMGQKDSEAFALPDGIAGGLYQANIQTVLRESYQLKLETDVAKSVFRWSFAGGEIPIGLVVRPSGIISGTPRVSRDEPYRFQVKVVDLNYAGSEPLKLDFILRVAPHRIRLAQVRKPHLVPINDVGNLATPETNRSFASHSSALSVNPDPAPSKSLGLAITPLRSSLETRREDEQFSTKVVPASFSGASQRVNDDSYNANLIRPVMDTLRVKPPEPISVLGLKGTKERQVDVANERISGDKIRGPAKVKLKNVNILRYDIRVGQDVTFPPAPNLTLPFIPPIPDQPQRSIPNAFLMIAAGDPIPDAFRQLALEFNNIELEKATNVNRHIVDATDNVNLVVSTLEALVAGSDSTLTTGGGPSAIIGQIRALIEAGGGATPLIDQALDKTWPDAKIEELLGRLEILRNGLITLQTIPVFRGDTTWVAWYTANQATYEAVLARVTELKTDLNGLKSNSAQGTAFRNSQNQLRRWKPILIGVRNGGVAGFEREVKVGCGFAFDTGKETKVKLIKRDRLADPGAGTTEEEIVTVVCSSPLSVSAGFGFSNIDEREFVFVPSTKTVTADGQTTQTVISRFGFRSKSAFRTLPVVLLNTRVWEPNDTFALHASTGAAVDIKTGEGGPDLEYIVGPSFSFWRSLLITPGLHIGRVNKLAGGFELDQEVPTGISAPPLEKTWKKGFVTTFTYKIR